MLHFRSIASQPFQMTDPGRVRSAEQFVVELTVHKLQEEKLLQGTLNSIVIVVWPSDNFNIIPVSLKSRMDEDDVGVDTIREERGES